MGTAASPHTWQYAPPACAAAGGRTNAAGGDAPSSACTRGSVSGSGADACAAIHLTTTSGLPFHLP